MESNNHFLPWLLLTDAPLLVREVNCFRKNHSSVGILYVKYKSLHSVWRLEIFSRTGSDTLTFRLAPRLDSPCSEWGGKILLRATFFFPLQKGRVFLWQMLCVRRNCALPCPFTRGSEPGLTEARLEKAALGTSPSQRFTGKRGVSKCSSQSQGLFHKIRFNSQTLWPAPSLPLLASFLCLLVWW